MAKFKLIRHPISKTSDAVKGHLMVCLPKFGWVFICNTLENKQYLIPEGKYPVSTTFSPKFKRNLPLLSNVPVAGCGPATLRQYGVLDTTCKSCGGERSANANDGAPDEQGSSRLRSPFRRRSGIRVHRGTKPQHSRGCILVNDRLYEDIVMDFISDDSASEMEVTQSSEPTEYHHYGKER